MAAKKKILIVEDEVMIVKVLSIRLESLGYKIAAAYDGEEGLAMVKKEKPDLIILDVGLPRIDGNTLCGLIKADPATKHIRVIMLTGKKLVGDMETSFSAGADLYMNKPYEWPRLVAHLHELLGEPK
ncbi:MAG: response regulator [Elusimicrobia bacterium]|nr:response regulator [Elusimicrobiota bacterium]